MGLSGNDSANSVARFDDHGLVRSDGLAADRMAVERQIERDLATGPSVSDESHEGAGIVEQGNSGSDRAEQLLPAVDDGIDDLGERERG